MPDAEAPTGDLAHAALPELVVQALTAVGKDRDVAEYRVCLAVLRNLGKYAPSKFTHPVGWSVGDQNALSALSAGSRRPEDMRSIAEGIPQIFGAWRCHVTDYETQEAVKLQTVVGVLRTLYKIRDRSTDTVLIDRMISSIGDLLALDWRCRDVPLNGDHRQWASRSTRRFDLLPISWRYL